MRLKRCALLLLFVFAAPVMATESTATPLGKVQNDVSILKSFFSKNLESTEKLNSVLPVGWSKDPSVFFNRLSEYEDKLLELKSKKPLTPLEEAEVELLFLKIQWIKTSPEEREVLLSDLRSKEISQKTNEKGTQLQEEAKKEVAISSKREQKLEVLANRAKDERESLFLQMMLQVEKQNQKILEYKKKLGEIQTRFSEQVQKWTELEGEIRKVIERGGADYLNYRTKLIERLEVSNERVKREDTLLSYYFSELDNVSMNIDQTGLAVRESDSDSVKKLIQDIHKKTIDLRTSIEILKNEKNELSKKLIIWEHGYRSRLLTVRGLVVDKIHQSQSEFLQNESSNPLLLETKTILSSTLFWFWSFDTVYINSHTNQKNVIRKVSDYAEVFKLILFVIFTFWLLKKRKVLIDKLKNFIEKRISGSKKKLAVWTSEIANDLYVFFIILLLGTFIIDLGSSLGFTFLEGLRPTLETVLTFFFVWGVIDFISPAISQRKFRFEKSALEVKAMEELFEFIPKLILSFYTLSLIIKEFLFLYLNSNFLSDLVSSVVMVLFVVALYFGVWTKKDSWRMIASKATDSEKWQKFIESTKGKIWEPFVLLFGGGLGVYLLAWKIVKQRVGELEFAKSFQAMVSRAILERKKRRSITKIVHDRFPTGYLDRFNYEVRANPHWHIKREKYLGVLDQAYDRWDSDKEGTTVLVCGDRGTGKSELIYSFLRDRKIKAKEGRLKPGDTTIQEVCKRVSSQIFDQEDQSECSADEFIEKVLSLEPSVILLENLENCILRQVDGFKTFTFIINLIMRTSGRHLWLVTFTPYAWTVAKRAVLGVDCFSHYLYLPGMSEEQIKKMILARHEDSSQLPLDFSGLAIEGKDKQKKVSQKEQEKAWQDLYFRILWDYTDGNPRQALYFWKTSLTFESNVAKVNLFDVPEQGILEGLRDKSLILLSALVEHNGLTLRDLSTVLNESKESVRMWIEEVMPYGIVYSFGDPRTDTYGWHIESFWMGAVEDYLEKRQMLFRGGLK